MSKFTDEGIRLLQKKSKERTVRTQNIEYDISTIIKKISDYTIKLDPEYQRKHRWGSDKSSRLIESLILNIPIPIIYISYDVDIDEATEEERYSVIDGQQRLRAISDYFSNQFALEGLDTLEEINGLKHDELPSFLQRRLSARTIRVIQIDSTIDAQVKYDIFERLNIGSLKLEPQEIRNASIRGKANDLINSLAIDKNFNALLQIDEKSRDENPKVKKMEDRELVLRFFAFTLGFEKLDSSNFSRVLTSKMRDINEMSDSDLKELESDFLTVMKVARDQFGDTAFARIKDTPKGRQYASRFNVAVYDALSHAILMNIRQGKKEFSESEKSKYYALFRSDEFITSISEGTNLRSRIEYRLKAVMESLE